MVNLKDLAGNAEQEEEKEDWGTHEVITVGFMSWMYMLLVYRFCLFYLFVVLTYYFPLFSAKQHLSPVQTACNLLVWGPLCVLGITFDEAFMWM